MSLERAQAFANVAGISPEQLQKFGNNFCFLPLISENLVALIKDEDYSVREATSAFIKEILSG